MSAFPEIDAATQDAISDEQAEFFRDNGLLVIRNVVRGAELALLQAETQPLIDQAAAGYDHPDFRYREHQPTGERTPCSIEYVIERTASGQALLGHPFILRTVEIRISGVQRPIPPPAERRGPGALDARASRVHHPHGAQAG